MDGIFPTKVFELIFVFMEIKEVLLVFILKVDALTVLLKKLPVAAVDVKVKVEILLVSVFEFKVLLNAFAITFVELILTLVEVRLAVVVFRFAVVIVPLKMVEFTSKNVEFILAF
jgi:hypothetical protein